MEVGLSTLRALREHSDAGRFITWRSALAPLAAERPAWSARLGYETALYHLSRLDHGSVREALTAWPDTLSTYPYGEFHRAAVLAELGAWERAARVASDALGRILEAQAAAVEPSLTLTDQAAAPAFAYLRMREEGGVPLRVGRFALDTEAAARAAQWIRPLAPAWGWAALFRSADKAAAGALTRPRVAGLDVRRASELYDTLIRGITSAESALSRGRDERGAALARLTGLLPALSRLAVRLDLDAEKALGSGIRLANHPVLQKNWPAYEAIGELIARAAKALAPETLRSRIADLMALPLVGRDLVSHGTIGRWFEPAELLPSLSLKQGDVRSDTVAGLIAVLDGRAPVPLASDPEKERRVACTYAATRLRYLYRNGALSEEQAEAFARAYWALTEDPDGLPALPSLTPAFALGVPPPLSGASRTDRVRRTFFATSIPTIADSAIGLPGPAGVYVGPLRAVTASEDEAPARNERIDWTAEEAAEILRRLAGWWDTDGARYQSEREQEAEQGIFLMSGADVLEDQLRLIPLLFRDVILPRITDADHVAEVRRVLDEMRKAGFATATAIAGLLRLGGVSAEEARDRIREHLAASESWPVEQGVWAVHRWVSLHAGEQIDENAHPLVDDLVGLIAVRRRPGLAAALEAATKIVEDVPAALDRGHADRLAGALTALREETAPPPPGRAWTASEIHEVPEPHHRGERAAATVLARSLQTWFEAHAPDEVPDELARWRTLAASSPLPEVRQAWPDDVSDGNGATS